MLEWQLRSRTVRWRDVSAKLVANILHEKSVFLKYSRIALKRHFKATEEKRRDRPVLLSRWSVKKFLGGAHLLGVLQQGKFDHKISN